MCVQGGGADDAGAAAAPAGLLGGAGGEDAGAAAGRAEDVPLPHPPRLPRPRHPPAGGKLHQAARQGSHVNSAGEETRVNVCSIIFN